MSRFPITFDKADLRSLVLVALPIVFQEFIYAALNMLDVIMIGQLGEDNVAAAGLSNQIFFLLMFLLFGICSGAAVFSAQYWGSGDLPGIRRVLGISLSLSLGAGVLFTVIALGFPRQALGVYTSDQNVIDLGSSHLAIAGFSYILNAVTFSYAFILRSTNHVRLPVMSSVVAIIIKSLSSYLLIFGHLGLPALGIRGAALGTVIARLVECGILLSITYSRHLPAAATLAQMMTFDRVFLVKFLKTSLPVAFNEMLWSLGISTYSLIYAHISTESIAAINITNTFESMAFVIFIGVSDACGILVGNKIGRGDENGAYRLGKQVLFLSTSGAILIGGLILSATAVLPALYNVSPIVLEYARRIMLVMGFCLWVRVSNMTAIVGILRSGGDTRFSLLLDGGVMWLVGVPTAFIAAFVFNLPVYGVYLAVISEELIKYGIALWRFRTRRWIHNLTQPVGVA